MAHDFGKQPEEQAIRNTVSPISGIAPPEASRWRKGQSGNPAGRKSAGATVVEWINSLAEFNADELRKIALDKKEPSTRRAAALAMIGAIEVSDLADFEPLLTGAMTLADLRESGVDTSLIKKLKRKNGEFGVDVEIELHDRSGAWFDRILDRTIGKPAMADLIERLEALELAAGGQKDAFFVETQDAA